MIGSIVLFLDSTIRIVLSIWTALNIIALYRSKRENKKFNWLNVIYDDGDKPRIHKFLNDTDNPILASLLLLSFLLAVDIFVVTLALLFPSS